jgi:putative peptidoglycan lipid II flippase
VGTEPSRLWRDRYELTDLVSHLSDSQLWRAHDNRLRRTVGLRIVSRRAPRFAQLQAGAVAAARITDRRFINVLDVMGPDPDDELVIITEWIPALALPEVLQEPMSPHGAATVMGQVADAIASAHAQGVTHGHLRPANVLLLADGAVRLRGHGVDAGLYGGPEGDPVAADIRGLGALLYACLTGRWPFEVRTGLPVARQVDGRPVPVDQTVADVPAPMLRIVDRCWSGGYTSAAQMAADLREAADSSWSSPHPRGLTTRRQKLVAAGLAAAMVGGGLAMSLADAANRSGDPVTAQTRAQGVADLVTNVPPDERKLPVVRVRDFDPFGVDGENPQQRRFAIDRDPLTAWTTLTYYDPFMGGKPGVGLTVDLGAPRPVSSVDLKLVGANSNLRVLAGTSRAADPARYRVFAEVTGAGSHILLRSPRPITARYIVIWFTRLPWIDGGYRGGVRSVVVRSG